MPSSIYVIGSLRNETIPTVGTELRKAGWDAFDDWYAAGPEADDKWKEYETSRGRSYAQALEGHAARHVFSFDKAHLDRCDAAVLVLPAGRSGHLELGYMAGLGKRTFVLFDQDYSRWDVMYQFADATFTDLPSLIQGIEQYRVKDRSSSYSILSDRSRVFSPSDYITLSDFNFKPNTSTNPNISTSLAG